MRMDIGYAIDIMEALADHPDASPGALPGVFAPETLCPRIEDERVPLSNPKVQRYFEHCKLLGEAGFVEVRRHNRLMHPIRLTYSGQEFVLAIQTPAVREHAESVTRKAGVRTLNAFATVVQNYIQQQLGV